MKQIKALLITLLFCTHAEATIENCLDLYVGKIRLFAPHGLQRFTLVENPQGSNSTTGVWSQWITLDPQDWGDAERQEVLSVLMYARAAKQRVTVNTDAADSCSIASSNTRLKLLEVQVVE